jgi:hypothetical protein
VLVVLRAADPADPDAFLADAQEALAALATRPGYLHGRVGRALDDPSAWVVTCEWESIGSARRGLTAGAVRERIMPLMARVVPEPNAFEILFAD